MKKIFKIIIFETIILVVLLLLLFLPRNEKLKTAEVCFRELALSGLEESKGCFEVEVVDTPLKRQQGLMFREHLNNDKGMLFVFEQEGDYPFWMKNTLIPLDMIWINQNQEIVFIKENAQPCEQVDCPIIEPGQNAKYVLEINGGVVKDINLTLGDKILF